MDCPDCGNKMKLVDTASGTQADGCDADVDLYRCPTCGTEHSD